MKRNTGRFLFVLWVLSMIFSVTSYAAPPLTLNFGINSTDSPVVVGQKFLPVLKEIEKALGKRLGQKVKIKFKIFRTYDKTIAAFTENKVDFGRLGPASYVLARQKNSNVRPLAMENRKGKKTFDGLIIVRKDSPIQTLNDLKGKTFAFGDDVSTIGRYLSQLELTKAGICSKDLAKFDYTGRHDNVFTGVALGRYDAGALKSSTFRERNKKKGELRVLHTFPNVTKPWLASAGLDGKLFGELQAAMLGLKDGPAFKKLKIKGFFPTTPGDYDIIEESMRKTVAFDTCS